MGMLIAYLLGILSAIKPQKDPEPAGTAKERAEQNQHVSPLWLDNLISKHEQTVREKSASDERNYRVQRSIKRATWCAFLAASIYATIAYRQWQDSSHNFQTDQRAWVGLKSVTIHFGLKPTPMPEKPAPTLEPWTFGEAIVVNSGKSPAFDVATYVLPWAVPGRKAETWDWPEIRKNLDEIPTKTASHSILVPNATVEISLERQLKREFRIPDIETEKTYAYLIGKITYRDVFRKQHTTIWCGRYNPRATSSADMIACPEGFEYAD